jgi:ABC-2 type transport system permease protein
MNARLKALTMPLSWSRLRALTIKETLQAMRDPSTLLIAFLLPPVLLFLFANAVSLDIKNVNFGVVLEGSGPAAADLAAAYAGTPYLRVTPARDRRELESLMTGGAMKGFVVIPENFDSALLKAGTRPQLQVITDGSEPNTATFVSGYAQGVLNAWYAGYRGSGKTAPAIDVEQRFWFNPELESRQVLLPGVMAVIMTMIGTLLTALVVAREWERGTMEAMMSTPAAVMELLLSKLAPYFLLGILATLGCTFMMVFFYGMPFRGSLMALLLVSAAFLVPALGQGLFISTVTKSQYLASQISVFAGFMPALLLSGFLYEIDTMPPLLQLLTNLVPARHYVEALQTIFLAGDLWPQLLRNLLGLAGVAIFFFGLTLLKTHKRLD